MAAMSSSVGPVVAEAYLQAREDCKLNCPSPEFMAARVCRDTTTCGGGGVPGGVGDVVGALNNGGLDVSGIAGGGGRRRGRTLLQLDITRDALLARRCTLKPVLQAPGFSA